MSWIWKHVVEAAKDGMYDRGGCISFIATRIPRSRDVTFTPKKTFLTELKNAINEELEKGHLEVVQINLKPDSHKKLCKELEQAANKPVRVIDTLFGIPVVVDDTIPQDRAWVIKRKKKVEE